MDWSAELSVESIVIRRDERQRKELQGIDELAESIRKRGLIQPIVITRNNELIAGERRLSAVKSLKHEVIRVVYSDELDPGELKALELEENIKRVDLPWKDLCLAIDDYHEYQRTKSKKWSQAQTGEALGIDTGEVSKRLAVAAEIRAGNKLVLEAPKLSTAKGIVQRQLERRASAETIQLTALVNPKPKPADSGVEGPSAPPPSGTGFVLNVDFLNWARDYDGDKFNLIHCDFPYGVGMHKSDQGSGDSYGTYEDTPEIYWTLVNAFMRYLDNFTEESAHLVFWFSMDYYEATRLALSAGKEADGRTPRAFPWRVNPFPLVWHKDDGAGILPDANRGPRRTYETAFLASRGDRKIVRAVANSVGCPISRGRHMSEKPQGVLRHYFRMLVDDHSSVLDPTCGSGSALRAAAACGASRFLGVELNKDFAEEADRTLDEQLHSPQIDIEDLIKETEDGTDPS